MTVNQASPQIYLRAVNGASTGVSNAFDVTSTVAANAQSVNVPYNTATAITLTGQDTANPGATLTYSIVTNPTNGVLSGVGANRTHTPNANYTGPDSFTFTVANGTIISAPVTVSITVLEPPGEIAIEQPVGSGLTDGVSTVNYGSIPILAGITRSFTVRNVGATNIVVSGITKDGTHSADITLGAISTSTIAASAGSTSSGSSLARRAFLPSPGRRRPTRALITATRCCRAIPSPPSACWTSAGHSANRAAPSTLISTRRAGRCG
jgi:hypothetical protein